MEVCTATARLGKGVYYESAVVANLIALNLRLAAITSYAVVLSHNYNYARERARVIGANLIKFIRQSKFTPPNGHLCPSCANLFEQLIEAKTCLILSVNRVVCNPYFVALPKRFMAKIDDCSRVCVYSVFAKITLKTAKYPPLGKKIGENGLLL